MQEMSTYLTSLPQFVDLGRQLTTLVLKLDLRTFETRIECRDLGVLGLDRRVVLAGHTFLLLDRVFERCDKAFHLLHLRLEGRDRALRGVLLAFELPHGILVLAGVLFCQGGLLRKGALRLAEVAREVCDASGRLGEFLLQGLDARSRGFSVLRCGPQALVLVFQRDNTCLQALDFLVHNRGVCGGR